MADGAFTADINFTPMWEKTSVHHLASFIWSQTFQTSIRERFSGMVCIFPPSRLLEALLAGWKVAVLSVQLWKPGYKWPGITAVLRLKSGVCNNRRDTPLSQWRSSSIIIQSSFISRNVFVVWFISLLRLCQDTYQTTSVKCLHRAADICHSDSYCHLTGHSMAYLRCLCPYYMTYLSHVKSGKFLYEHFRTFQMPLIGVIFLVMLQSVCFKVI